MYQLFLNECTNQRCFGWFYIVAQVKCFSWSTLHYCSNFISIPTFYSIFSIFFDEFCWFQLQRKWAQSEKNCDKNCVFFSLFKMKYGKKSDNRKKIMTILLLYQRVLALNHIFKMLKINDDLKKIFNILWAYVALKWLGKE